MINLFKMISWKQLLSLVSFSFIIFLVERLMFLLISEYNYQKYGIAIPVIICLVVLLASKTVRKIRSLVFSLESACLISMVLLYLSIKVQPLGTLIDNGFQELSFITVSIFLVSIILSKVVDKNRLDNNNELSNQLFNLFYLNTSKAHEIAMLIDNKIMKAIEKEQVSEELLKYNSSIVFGKKEMALSEMSYSREDSSKKRVYENFDVKTTKSIMLRKIYESAQKKKAGVNKLATGDLVILNNIELKQMNIDDTIMILNLLQDSKIKNPTTDDIEININKMLDKMLDDFTVDYKFDYCEKEFIIQLPYKSADNFENGYQHNDLQLGILSLIGIYRGEIDFSKKDSISSSFLELISESYNREGQQSQKNSGMKNSHGNLSSNDIPIEFAHKKLDEKLHLIDVIAIIQELNLDGNT